MINNYKALVIIVCRPLRQTLKKANLFKDVLFKNFFLIVFYKINKLKLEYLKTNCSLNKKVHISKYSFR